MEYGQDIEPQTLFKGLKTLKIIDVQALENYHLLVTFNNQITKKYNMSQLFDLEIFKPLKNIDLFTQAKAQSYGIVWNEEIDIAEYELWINGQEII